MNIREMPDLRTMTPPTTPPSTLSAAKSESIEIAVKVIEQKTSLPADVAIKTLVRRIRQRAFDSQRAAIARESVVASALTRESFARNYGLADLAKVHVRAMLTHGSNATPDARLGPHEARTRIAALRDERRRILEELVEDNDIPWRCGFNLKGQEVVCVMQADVMRISAYLLKKWGYGHCEEQASAAWRFLRECDPHGSLVEVFRFEGGDHMLVVIGRERDSDLEDMSTWGPDAVVCDPWADKVYPLSAFDEMRLPRNDVRDFLALHRMHCLTGTMQRLDEDRWGGLP
ncbi:hypothetical protein [Variovorax sp. PBL-E5]|uniref:hypothetical protein n=1 Tax=Variovorax sp. PBL-E5 TaxID=434014 RepID=UPI0013170AE7|nr:hypothetical protein [Variovorax sp. PBL-E5]VTU39035.1 hypothetical protein E5CHR_04975 [Variovorax sp. PBL-E5]